MRGLLTFEAAMVVSGMGRVNGRFLWARVDAPLDGSLDVFCGSSVGSVLWKRPVEALPVEAPSVEPISRIVGGASTLFTCGTVCSNPQCCQ